MPVLRVLDLRTPAPTADHEAWRRLCARSAGLAGEADLAAREVIAAVRDRGDAAVSELTARFEGRTLDPAAFEVDAAARAAAAARVDPELRAAMALAAANVRAFHETQRPRDTGLDAPGARLVSRARPLRRVAVYAPGGTAAYPSSVLMAAIPAKVAGVDEVILLTPRPADVVLLAAELAGVDRVFAVGGAQAIAAAALGTAAIPRVDKIVGPGNAFVTAAKRQVFGLVDIDGIAGPSEVLVLADAAADPALIAADLLAQAEHDVLACPILVTDAPALVAAVEVELAHQLGDLPRRDIAARALVDHGAAVLVRDRDGMVDAADAYAPEHLELLLEGPAPLVERLRTAGAIFVGPWTPEAAGDYTAGPSHVLPTAGAARFASPLGVWDFIKVTSVLELGPAALRDQAPAIARLARAEGLEAHARAVLRRLT
jgi:histidinol dehydrogenase